MSDNGLEHNVEKLRPEERWVVQMFSGSFHNIGNVVAAARLTLGDLQEAFSQDNDAVLKMVLDELLPVLEQHQREGTAAEFLRDDAQGQEYVGSIRELLQHHRNLLLDQRRNLDMLGTELRHVTNILLVQQRMLRGLGATQAVAVEQLIEDAVMMMGAAATRHKVRLETNYSKTRRVDIEPTMVTQVLINLVKNAIEALDSVTNRERVVRLSTRTEGDGVVCEVQDTGPGIAAADHEEVFKFGFTTKGGDQDGRGVGLHFCRKVMQKYGRITVQSVKGEGATLALCFEKPRPSEFQDARKHDA